MTRSVNPIGIPVLNIGRDVNGKFTKGNPGGPGNPFARKVASLRKALLDCVSEQDLKEMIETLKTKARLGDKGAIRLILQYCVGKPTPAPDPDRMDIDEWDRLQKMSVPQEQFDETTQSIPACVACHTATYHWPCMIQEGEGPIQSAIHGVHMDMIARGEPAAPYSPPADTDPDLEEPSANEAGQSSEPLTPAPRPAQPRTRPESAGTSRRDTQSSAQPPSPNDECTREQMRTIEILKQAFRPTEQPQDEPPKG